MRNALKNILNFADAAAAFPPDAPAFLRGENEFVSRKKFFAEIAALAEFFNRREEKTFLLFSENPVFFAEHFFALLAAGKNVALPPTNAPAFLENLQKSFDAPLVSDAPVEEKILRANADACREKSAPIPSRLADADVILFSSGSTATPKPIRKKLSTFTKSAEVHAENFLEEFFSKNAAETPLPLFTGCVHCNHLYGLIHKLLLPFALGACIDAELLLSPEKLIARQRAFPQICFIATPSFLGKIAHYREQYSFPRNCFRISSSGSALDEKTARATQEIFGVAPMEIYGSSEAGGVATRRQADGAAWHVLRGVEISETPDGNARVRSPFCIPPETIIFDAIKMLSPKEFLLFGRTDRLVKIAEKRVSLPEIESLFEGCEFVHKAHLLALENSSLAAVIEPSERGISVLKTGGKHAFVAALKTALAETIEPGVFPKKIRVVNEIPTNPQGKILHKEMLALFAQNIAEPILENFTRAENVVAADATFLPDAIYFRGHFPTFPLLPGVVQLHFAHFFAQKFFNKILKISVVKKLKFSAMIFPGETVRLELHDAPTQVAFSFKKGDTLCSSGIFCTPENEDSKNV